MFLKIVLLCLVVFSASESYKRDPMKTDESLESPGEMDSQENFAERWNEVRQLVNSMATRLSPKKNRRYNKNALSNCQPYEQFKLASKMTKECKKGQYYISSQKKCLSLCKKGKKTTPDCIWQCNECNVKGMQKNSPRELDSEVTDSEEQVQVYETRKQRKSKVKNRNECMGNFKKQSDRDCSHYITCTNGKLQEMSCNSNQPNEDLYFDQYNNNCTTNKFETICECLRYFQKLNKL